MSFGFSERRYGPGGSSPLVTVVVPVHGAYHQFLGECLASVIAQDYHNWEAIVVDDGCQPHVVERQIAVLSDPRISYVRHDRNRGLAAARNTGIRKAGGTRILPLDADDKLSPNCLSELTGALERHPSAAAVLPYLHAFGAADCLLEFTVRDVRSLLEEQWIPGAGTMYRRDLWELVGGYCESDVLRAGNEDWDFWLSAVARGLEITSVQQPLYFYRQHHGSMVRTLQYTDHITREFIYRRHQRLFDQYGMGRRFLGEGYRRAARSAARTREWRRAISLGMQACRLDPGNYVRQELKSVGRLIRRVLHDRAPRIIQPMTKHPAGNQ